MGVYQTWLFHSHTQDSGACVLVDCDVNNLSPPPLCPGTPGPSRILVKEPFERLSHWSPPSQHTRRSGQQTNLRIILSPCAS
jgi:hypothetical protein